MFCVGSPRPVLRWEIGKNKQCFVKIRFAEIDFFTYNNRQVGKLVAYTPPIRIRIGTLEPEKTSERKKLVCPQLQGRPTWLFCEPFDSTMRFKSVASKKLSHMSYHRLRFTSSLRHCAARPILTFTLALALSAILPTIARAATSLIVTTTADEDNGTSDPTLGAGTSLREALIFANSNPDLSTITFDLPGAGPFTLTLLSALPNIIADTNFDNSSATAKAITVARSSAAGTPIFNIFTIFRDTVSGPAVTISALTLSNGSGNPNNGGGGAIFNALGALTINNCTLSNNSANFGGAIVNSGGILVVNNSTFSGNRAIGSTESQDGGGVLDTFGGTVTFTSCTLTNNAAPNVASGTRGGLWIESGTLTLRNTLVAGNAVQDIQRNNNGVLVSQGYNLVGLSNDTTPFGATDHLGITAPLLGALADNGGLSATHALLAASRAVDSGDPTITSGTDQRGLPRVKRGRADIGAYEVQNERPTAANFSKNLNEDSPLVLTAADFTGAFSDPEADTLRKIRVTALPTNGALTLNGATVTPGQEIALANLGGLSYAPIANFNGTDSLAYNAADAFGFGANSATVTLQVLAVNDAPSFMVGVDQMVAEDSGSQVLASFATHISAGPPNENAQTVTFNVTNNNPALFSVQPSIAPNGTLSYTPAPNANGAATVTVVLKDSGGTTDGGVDTSASQSFTITINAVNDAPVVDLNGGAPGTGFSATFTEGGGAVTLVDSANLTVSDVDTPNLVGAKITLTNPLDGSLETLSATPFGQLTAANIVFANNTLTISGNAPLGDYQAVLRSVKYQNLSSNLNTTPRQITFVVNDGVLDSNVAVSTLQVLAANNPPVAQAATATTNEDTPVGFALNASDAENATLSFAVVSGPQNGTLSGTAPNLIYTPNANFNGTDALTFRANDGQTSSNLATITLQVLAVNDAPSFTIGAHQVVNENSGPQVLAGFATDIAAGPANENAQTVAFRVTNNNNALFSVQPAIAPDGTLSYTPAPNSSGVATMSVVLKDNGGTGNGGVDSSAPQIFTLQVLAVNRAPVAVAQSVSTNEDTPATLVLSATDRENDALNYRIVTAPAHGTLSGVAPNLTYTPAANYNGADAFTFQANDGKSDSNLAIVALQVLAVNDAPVALAQPLATDNATPLAITLSASDVDGDALSFAVTTNPQHGTLSGSAPNLIYTAMPGFRGSDSFAFMVSDGTETSQAIITIVVSGDTPVQASDDAFTLVIGAPGQAQQAGVVFLSSGIFQISGPGVLRNDSVADAKTASARAISNPKKGRFQLRRDGTLFYVPYNNQVGTDEFSYALSDGKTSASAKVRLNIVDKRAPEMAFDTPRDRATLQKIGKIAGRVRDRNSGVKSVTLLWQRFDGKFWNGSAWVANAIELPTVVQGINWVYGGKVPAPGNNPATDLLPGRYDLRATASDGSGNLQRITNRIIVAAETPAPEFSTVRLSSAAAGQDAIVLNFTGALNVASTSDAMHYALAVNGKIIAIGAASYANNVVILSGIELKAGDKIVLQLKGLKDAVGKILKDGTINLVAR